MDATDWFTIEDNAVGNHKLNMQSKGKKVKFSHIRYRASDPEQIPVYKQSARM